MDGKIDKSGILHIERADGMKCMNCANNAEVYCCDLCALFGEPERESETLCNSWNDEKETIYTGRTIVRLCHKTLYFGSFADERVEA